MTESTIVFYDANKVFTMDNFDPSTITVEYKNVTGVEYIDGQDRFYRWFPTSPVYNFQSGTYALRTWVPPGESNNTTFVHSFLLESGEFYATLSELPPINHGALIGITSPSLVGAAFYDDYGRGIMCTAGSPSGLSSMSYAIAFKRSGSIGWGNNFSGYPPGDLAQDGVIYGHVNNRFYVINRVGLCYESSPTTEGGELTWTSHPNWTSYAIPTVSYTNFGQYHGIMRVGKYYVAGSAHALDPRGQWKMFTGSPPGPAGAFLRYGVYDNKLVRMNFWLDKEIPDTITARMDVYKDDGSYYYSQELFTRDLPEPLNKEHGSRSIYDACVAGNFLLVIFMDGRYMYSNDGGETWSMPPSHLSYYRFFWCENGKIKILASTNAVSGNVLLSSDKMSGFQELGLAFPNAHNHLNLGSVIDRTIGRMGAFTRVDAAVEQSRDGRTWNHVLSTTVHGISPSAAMVIRGNENHVFIAPTDAIKRGCFESSNGVTFGSRSMDIPNKIFGKDPSYDAFRMVFWGDNYHDVTALRFTNQVSEKQLALHHNTRIVYETPPLPRSPRYSFYSDSLSAHSNTDLIYSKNLVDYIQQNKFPVITNTLDTIYNDLLSTKDYEIFITRERVLDDYGIPYYFADKIYISDDNFTSADVIPGDDLAYTLSNDGRYYNTRGGILWAITSNLIYNVNGFDWVRINLASYVPGLVPLSAASDVFFNLAARVPFSEWGQGWKLGSI